MIRGFLRVVTTFIYCVVGWICGATAAAMAGNGMSSTTISIGLVCALIGGMYGWVRK